LLKRGLDEILTNNGGAKLPYIYSTNKSDDSFRKETAPFLSIFTLAVTDNQLENCARNKSERKTLAPPTEIGNRFFTSVDLVEITERCMKHSGETLRCFTA